MNPDQVKAVTKSITRADAVKVALAEMRAEIEEGIRQVEELLAVASEEFEAATRNRVRMVHDELIRTLTRESGADPQSISIKVNYDYESEPDTVLALVTDGESFNHRFRVFLEVRRPSLGKIRELRQQYLVLKERAAPEAEEAREKALKDALDSTDEGRAVLAALKALRNSCK